MNLNEEDEQWITGTFGGMLIRVEQNLERRFDEKLASMEDRFDEKLDGMETRLLPTFQKWASPVEIR